MSHITAENCKLLEMLCLLLNEQELQLGAAECLLIAVSRKVSYHFKLTFILKVSAGWCVSVSEVYVVAGRHQKVWDFFLPDTNFIVCLQSLWIVVFQDSRDPLAAYTEICRATLFLKLLRALAFHTEETR